MDCVESGRFLLGGWETLMRPITMVKKAIYPSFFASGGASRGAPSSAGGVWLPNIHRRGSRFVSNGNIHILSTGAHVKVYHTTWRSLSSSRGTWWPPTPKKETMSGSCSSAEHAVRNLTRTSWFTVNTQNCVISKCLSQYAPNSRIHGIILTAMTRRRG